MQLFLNACIGPEALQFSFIYYSQQKQDKKGLCNLYTLIHSVQYNLSDQLPTVSLNIFVWKIFFRYRTLKISEISRIFSESNILDVPELNGTSSIFDSENILILWQ